jgi:hypothetical protein
MMAIGNMMGIATPYKKGMKVIMRFSAYNQPRSM